MMTFQQLIFLLYQNKLYQRPDSLLAQIYLKNFIIFRLILFTVRLKIENFRMVIIFMLLMVLNSNFQIQNPILILGEMFGYPDHSRRFTMGLASVVYDVLDDYIIHASFISSLLSFRTFRCH